MTLPDGAKYLIDIITKSGYEAYAVGGCVRDFLMKRPCHDVDITTSAMPDETERILALNGVRYIETGIKHGTVTAVVDGVPFEITTYRTDGSYTDNRRPDSVEFVRNIKDDLARRDFTINAMAYNDDTGYVDLFGGKQDLDNGIIRAVGNPDKRFKEDALRIMRAIRFASVLGMQIEPETKKALFDNKQLLLNVSAERIYTELSKLLMGRCVYDVLVEYRDIIAVVVPELALIFDVEQNTKWHIYDAWHHTAKAVEVAPMDLALRYTMLLHDIGKAFTRTTDENGVDHFKGHQKVSAEYADTALKRLKAPNEVYNRAMLVIPIHDIHIGIERRNVKKWLSKLGEKGLRDLIEVKRSDKLAQNPVLTADELERLKITESVLDEIIAEGEPFRRSDLAVNGNDLSAIGIKGKSIGTALNILLDMVISEKLSNEKAVLLKYIVDNLPNMNL